MYKRETTAVADVEAETILGWTINRSVDEEKKRKEEAGT